VGEIPIELQAKFLRVLEEERLRRLGGKSEITVDVRVISATNRDLKEEIRSGRFREDLYFRLNVFHLNLAPLKERREDIPVLVQHFIDRFSRDAGKKLHGVSPQAMKLLADYAWPGNIRELRNTLERAVILCGTEIIDPEHLPSELAAGGGESAYLKLPYGLPLREIEKEYILATLSGCRTTRRARRRRWESARRRSTTSCTGTRVADHAVRTRWKTSSIRRGPPRSSDRHRLSHLRWPGVSGSRA